MKRTLAFLCALALMLSLVPGAAFAATQDLQAEIDAGAETIVLEADASDITVTRDTTIDLNGHDLSGVTVLGGTLYLQDSQTADYTVADGVYGHVTGVTGNVKAAEGYLQVGDSFHAVNLDIYAMTLRATDVGVYYKSHFAADEIVAAQVESFGVALSVVTAPNASNLETYCGYSDFTGFEAGEGANSVGTSTLLKGIMKAANGDSKNAKNAAMPVYGRAYIKTADGYFFGETVKRSLQEQVEAIDKVWNKLTDAQKTPVLAMLEGYTTVMENWNIPNIRGIQVPGADADIEIPIEVTAENGVVTEAVTVEQSGVSVTVPAGTKLAANATGLTVLVTEKETSEAGLTLEESEVLMPMDVHVEGLAADNTAPLTIYLGKVMAENLNMGNYAVYHVENGKANEMVLIPVDAEFTAHNQYKYSLDGELTLYMATFSEVAVVSEDPKWEGNRDYSWYTNAVAPVAEGEEVVYEIRNADQLAALSAIVGGMDGQTQDSFAGKTIKLLANIDLNDAENSNKSWIFYPIGYYNSEGTYERTNTAITSGLRNFEGTFDGNGHTVSNFYHNTWEMKGDHNWYSPEEQYYRDGMGLFGRVYKGTVKNLTVRNFKSDGEIATTGVIAAYADGATFENIAIFDCNPRVYNIGNGGIVGCVGWYAKEANLTTTFTNITVDNSNKISALWGSYDVACGGIVGQYYCTSGQTSANKPSNGGITLTNCHVSAQMDVYNDVCANYQYYAYRYAGMLIGSVSENETIDGHVYPKMDGITASGCTVHFGDWNDYYYCELVANSLASYTHDHQMSRLVQVEKLDVDAKKYLPLGKDDVSENWVAIPESGRQNYVVVNGKTADGKWDHGDGKATCYHFVNGVQHKHDVADSDNPNVYETVDGKEVLVEDKQCIYREFNNLVTGYGWGVTTKAVTDFPKEQVKILDREEANSVVKFDSIAKDSYTTGTTVTIGELFAAKNQDEVAIVKQNVQVTISPDLTNDPDSTVSGTYTANTTDWTQGTLTFSGFGAATITITDYYFCQPTTIDVSITERVAEEKFEIAFDHDPNTDGNQNNVDKYLYRVGNQNAVTLSSLFEAKNGADIGTVSVTVETIIGASGTYTPNATWTNGTIQFSGTGVVQVTITDNDYCIPTELILEVVDAKNVTAVGGSDGVDIVLLQNLKISANGTVHYKNCTVYGNGFTFDVSGGMNQYNSKQGHGIIIIVNATLDHLRIVGDVYDEYGMYAKDSLGNILNDYTSAVDATSSTIQNCYIANCAAPIRSNGNTIIDTTLYGGTVANLLISGGTNTLTNVTTINYNDGRGVIGMGIVITDGANPDSTKLVLNGYLKQHNYVYETDVSEIRVSEAKTVFNSMFEDKFSNYHIGSNPKAVNTGIISIHKEINLNNDVLIDNANTEYLITNDVTVKVSGMGASTTANAAIASVRGSDGKVDNVYENKGNAQGDYLPTLKVELGTQMDANTGADDTRYLVGNEDGIEALYQSNESPITIDLTKLANAVKYGQKLEVSVTYKDSNGEVIGTDKTVTLTDSGILEFTVKDTFLYDKNGNRLEKTVDRKYEVPLTLSIKEATIKNAEIKVNKTSINGDYNSSKYMTFNPLEAITVTDYDANGTGTTVTLNKNISSKKVEYNNTSSGAWGGATITITYTDGRVLTVNLGTSTLNSPGASNGGKTITIQSDGSIKTDGKVANSSATGGTWTINGYSFKGNNGTTVTNNTKVTVNFADESGCVTGDTLVTLADGTQKRIDEVTYDDQLLVWNFHEGKMDAVPSSIIFYHGDELYEVLTLKFEDGTEVKTINVHGFFDVDSNEFVFIEVANVETYIGRSFAKVNGTDYTAVKLVGYELSEEYTGSYSIQTAMHINFMVEGMFSITVPPLDGWFDYFEIGEGMKYDEEKMQADIEKYGLYTYEDFAEYVTYEQFIAFNGPYLKVLVGRGVLTYEEILSLIATYVN